MNGRMKVTALIRHPGRHADRVQVTDDAESTVQPAPEAPATDGPVRLPRGMHAFSAPLERDVAAKLDTPAGASRFGYSVAAPPIPVAPLAEDLRNLPAFRETVCTALRAHQGVACWCGYQQPGKTVAERCYGIWAHLHDRDGAPSAAAMLPSRAMRNRWDEAVATAKHSADPALSEREADATAYDAAEKHLRTARPRFTPVPVTAPFPAITEGDAA
jgi:hypothetical protein